MGRWTLIGVLAISVFLQFGAVAQQPSGVQPPATRAITRAMEILEAGLLKQDTTLLAPVLHTNMEMGHANGLVEKRQDLLDHIGSGFLKYKKIEPKAPPHILIEGNMARVRRQVVVALNVNDKELAMQLSIMEIWKLEPQGWQLWSRQSVQINNN
jgi:hypothetical protein